MTGDRHAASPKPAALPANQSIRPQLSLLCAKPEAGIRQMMPSLWAAIWEAKLPPLTRAAGGEREEPAKTAKSTHKMANLSSINPKLPKKPKTLKLNEAKKDQLKHLKQVRLEEQLDQLEQQPGQQNLDRQEIARKMLCLTQLRPLPSWLALHCSTAV